MGLQPEPSKLKNARANTEKATGRDLNNRRMQAKLVFAKIQIKNDFPAVFVPFAAAEGNLNLECARQLRKNSFSELP